MFLGEVFTENPHNRKGNRESAAIQALNDDVLAQNDGAWDQPVEVSRWTDAQAAQRDEIIGGVSEGASGWWGFKDPRIVLTLPFWLPAIEQPKFIGTYRHPRHVATSLARRNGMALEDSLQLWLAYNRKLIGYAELYGLDLIDFDLPDGEYVADMANKLARLGLAPVGAGDFFDAGLRHQQGEPGGDGQLPADIEATYRQLKELHAVV